jgi:hypothetical protein
MSSGAVVYICRSRSRAVESLGGEFEAWEREHSEARAARDVEDWIGECLRSGEAALLLVSHTRARLRSNRLDNPQEAGESLLQLCEATLRVFERVQAGLEAAKRKGYTIENEGAFSEMHSRLGQAQQRLRQHWPWFNQDMWDRTAAAISRGEVQTAEEIVHELRGDHPPTDQG